MWWSFPARPEAFVTRSGLHLKQREQCSKSEPNRLWQRASTQCRNRHASNSNTFFRPDAWFSSSVLIEVRKQRQANQAHSKLKCLSLYKNIKNQGGICKDVFTPTLQYIAMFGMLDVPMEPLTSVAECCQKLASEWFIQWSSAASKKECVSCHPTEGYGKQLSSQSLRFRTDMEHHMVQRKHVKKRDKASLQTFQYISGLGPLLI